MTEQTKAQLLMKSWDIADRSMTQHERNQFEQDKSKPGPKAKGTALKGPDFEARRQIADGIMKHFAQQMEGPVDPR